MDGLTQNTGFNGLLSALVFLPFVFALLIFVLPRNDNQVRLLAVFGGIVELVLSVFVFVVYNRGESGFQLIDRFNSWIPVDSFRIEYFLGVDGLSVPMVLLTGMVIFTGVLISWGIDDRPREFFAFLFLLATGVFGVFVALDLFHLFFFYEISVFPMYLLIAIWGWKVTREYAAMKLTLYLFIGSV